MKKVLFVEDDRFLVRAYSSLLRKEGFDTFFLENGLKVLQTVKKKKPDLIVLDLIMPEKDGFSVLEDLKKNKKTKNYPVITLSVLSQKEDIEKLRSLGVKKHIIKSDLTFKQIIKIIKNEFLG